MIYSPGIAKKKPFARDPHDKLGQIAKLYDLNSSF